MGVLTAIVQPTTCFLRCFISNYLHRGTVRTQSVRYNHLRFPIPFHDFLKKNHCCLAVASLGNKGFQNLTLVVNGTPQVICLAIDLHKYFVQVPSPVGVIPGRRMKSFLTDLARKQGTKSIPPIADCFMADINAAFMKKIFDIAKRKRKPDIHHHRKANDLR